MRRPLGLERAAGERRERALRRQPDAVVTGRQKFFCPGGECATGRDRVDSEMVGRRHAQRKARADQRSAIEIVVACVSPAIGQDDRRCDGEGVEAIHRPGVPAAIGHVAQRGRITAVVPLRRVGETDVVTMACRAAGRVDTRNDPGGDVGLGQRPPNRPIGAAAGRRADRDIGHAAGKVVAAEQLLRVVEGAGRQEIELAGKWSAAEQARGQLRRRAIDGTDAPNRRRRVRRGGS